MRPAVASTETTRRPRVEPRRTSRPAGSPRPAGTPGRSGTTHRTTPRKRRGAHARPARPLFRAALILLISLVVSAGGWLYSSGQTIVLQNAQDELLQAQSTYAETVGLLSTSQAPSQVAAHAGALHLAHPDVVIQVPSVSLTTPLPLPRFLGYAPAVPRTQR